MLLLTLTPCQNLNLELLVKSHPRFAEFAVLQSLMNECYGAIAPM